jgi:hypothetical protein
MNGVLRVVFILKIRTDIDIYDSVEITNKMEFYNRIYYSTVHWRLSMFRAAVVKFEFPLRLDYGRSPHAYVNQRLQIQLKLLMMSGIPLETCWAFNERWNNKFCYKIASCWLFPLNLIKCIKDRSPSVCSVFYRDLMLVCCCTRSPYVHRVARSAKCGRGNFLRDTGEVHRIG